MMAVLTAAWWLDAPRGRALRPPWSILRRGIGCGVVGGAVLGAALQASDGAYRSWATVGFAALVGALVALPAALAAVIVYQAVEGKGLRLAWLAGSFAAALAVVGVALVLGVFDAPAVAVCAAVALAVAFMSAPVVTTRRNSISEPDEAAHVWD
ncbi:hypothetical protein GCM10009593_38300 [Microlunatus antarcticus]